MSYPNIFRNMINLFEKSSYDLEFFQNIYEINITKICKIYYAVFEFKPIFLLPS